MSHPLPISLPDSVYNCLDKAAKAEGKQIRDFIIDSAMQKVCGMTKAEFLEMKRKELAMEKTEEDSKNAT